MYLFGCTHSSFLAQLKNALKILMVDQISAPQGATVTDVGIFFVRLGSRIPFEMNHLTTKGT